MVQMSNELDTQHIYILDASDDLPLGLIPSIVNHKTDHKGPKLLIIPMLNNTYNRVCISRATTISTLNPVELKALKSAIYNGPLQKITGQHEK